MRSAKQGITWKMILSAAGDSGNEKDHSPYNLGQKPWNTWKISLPFVSPFPFAMLLWPSNFAIDISTLQGEREEHRCFKDFWRGLSSLCSPLPKRRCHAQLIDFLWCMKSVFISSPPEGSWISVIRIYCSYMEWSYTDFSYNPRCILLIGCGVYISVTLLPSAACSRVYNQGRRLIE